MKRYCAGILTQESEDFYWDTQFSSVDECIEWALSHECTHFYDSVTDTFTKI